MRAVFLDRDGVICQNRRDHVKSWREFAFLPGARDALARLAALDVSIVVITNQAAINRGLVSAEMVEEIHRLMVAEVEAAGGRIDGIFYCPHRPDEGCGCRKPEPGMLTRAALELDLDLRGSYLVGDAWDDIKAGLAVGCRPLMVLTGRGSEQAGKALREAPGCFQLLRDLPEAITEIMRLEEDRSRKNNRSDAVRARPDLKAVPRIEMDDGSIETSQSVFVDRGMDQHRL
jgi:D-glycero-D-manno-heptose 1,7-bisphosphate phosphatase